MYIGEENMRLVRELQPLRNQYYEVFGSYFPPFNLEDYYEDGRKSIDVYRERLETCLAKRIPYEILYKKEIEERRRLLEEWFG